MLQVSSMKGIYENNIRFLLYSAKFGPTSSIKVINNEAPIIWRSWKKLKDLSRLSQRSCFYGLHPWPLLRNKGKKKQSLLQDHSIIAFVGKNRAKKPNIKQHIIGIMKIYCYEWKCMQTYKCVIKFFQKLFTKLINNKLCITTKLLKTDTIKKGSQSTKQE